MAKAKVKKKTERFDFDEEEDVLKAMAKELDCKVEDLSIRLISDFNNWGSDAYLIELGNKEYIVVRNEDEAESMALQSVTNDLEESPENFNSDFVQSHIDIDRLRRDLSSDVENMAYESLKEDAEHRPVQFIKDNNLNWPEPTEKQLREHAEAMSDDENSVADIYAKLKEGDAEDQWNEMGEDPEVPDSDITDIAEAQAKDQLRDPIEYLQDIYGKEDGIAKAVEIGGIDIKAAAEEAVSADGAGHFLSTYDGNIKDGPFGVAYWRTN